MSIRFVACFLAFAALCGSQITPGQPEEPAPHFPNAHSQREAMLKSEHEHSLKDSEELVKLAEEFKSELEKNDRYVLSVSALKKLDRIEQLTKRIRGRMKRF